MNAYHFLDKNSTLRDGSPAPDNGVWLEHTGPVKICRSGLHASERLIDALKYAPGTLLCWVECDQIENRQDDKFVCRRRKIIRRKDITAELRQFARWCALDVAHLWDMPLVVRQYLETGDAKLRADAEADAEIAARAAWALSAKTVVKDAAQSAAQSAIRIASSPSSWVPAAWDVAKTAAEAAAWAAWDSAVTAAEAADVEAAARVDTWKKYDRKLEELVN